MAEHPLKRTKAPSGGSNAPVVPQLRAKKKPARPQPSQEGAPPEKGGIFMDIFKTILRLKNRGRAVEQAIEDALKGKT